MVRENDAVKINKNDCPQLDLFDWRPPAPTMATLERELRDARTRIDAERFGEQLLAFSITRTIGSPSAEQSDRFVWSPLFDQPSGDAPGLRAQRRYGGVCRHR